MISLSNHNINKMNLINNDVVDYINETLSALTIALLMVPEAIAFSFILGLSPTSGIHTTMIMSLITSIFGGCPTLVTGASGSVATSLLGIRSLLGEEYIYLAVILGGIIQLLFAATNMYNLVDYIPSSVSSGFLIALGILIAYFQIENLKDKDGKWLDERKLETSISFSMISAIISYFLIITVKSPAFVTLNLKIPGGLLSMVFLSIIFYLIPNIGMNNIGEKGHLSSYPKFHLPQVDLNFMNILKTLPFAIAVAVAGLTESIFMLKEASTTLKIKGEPFNETIAQGIANIISGFFGGIGGCVLVGQSKYNLENGAKSKFSSIAVSIIFIILTLFFSKTIENIPIPAIIGIMMVIAYKTGDWSSLFNKTGKLTTIITAVVGIVSKSLTLGIVTGTIFDKFFG
jgi:sulfate permease, SulP family